MAEWRKERQEKDARMTANTRNEKTAEGKKKHQEKNVRKIASRKNEEIERGKEETPIKGCNEDC